MKREIRFRGRCVNSGDFVYGDLIHGVGHKSGNVYILPNKLNLAYVKHCDPLDGVKVDPDTVGQFTGLKDNNGKEVYESDIVTCSKGCPHRIEFVMDYGGTFIGGMPAFYLSELMSGYSWTGVEEVIGNIYENPELLQP